MWQFDKWHCSVYWIKRMTSDCSCGARRKTAWDFFLCSKIGHLWTRKSKSLLDIVQTLGNNVTANFPVSEKHHLVWQWMPVEHMTTREFIQGYARNFGFQCFMFSSCVYTDFPGGEVVRYAGAFITVGLRSRALLSDIPGGGHWQLISTR